MRRFLGNVISIAYSFFRLCFLKLFHPKGFKFNLIERISPNVVIEMSNKSSLFLSKKVRVHSGSKIKVRKGASLLIENDVKINYNCVIVARKSISIGSETEFGPGVMVFDHDHSFETGLKSDDFCCDDIRIGKRCWIGANTIILRGTIIGDDCVIAAGSVVKGIIEPKTLFIQKRDTFKKRIGQ